VGNQHLKGICEKIPGIRILQQDPWECTISFICSQNNNISRITKLLFSLREKYGKFIIEKHNQKHYAFPTLEDLKEAKAQHLRDMGFGYRA
jgi:N-glycosylase/DNA lyase